MNLVFLSATCILLAVGSITHSKPMAIAGSALFLVNELAHLVCAYRAARLYREGRDEEWRKGRTTFQKIIDSIWNWLPIVGLISMGVGSVTNNDAMAISGGALWFGRIISYLIGGFIIQDVAGVPLRMTHGGWKMDRSQRKRR